MHIARILRGVCDKFVGKDAGVIVPLLSNLSKEGLGEVAFPRTARVRKGMTLHFNRSDERQKRRTLRNDPSEAERKLWWHLRGKQIGAKFRRQYSVDSYVIDFYAPSCKLAVEIDGDSHFTPQGLRHDRERTAHLARFGIQVIRFTNLEVFENIEAVLEAIAQAVRRTNLP